MAKSLQVTVATGATPTKLDAPETTDRYPGNTLFLKNTGTIDVLIGGLDVTTANGYRGLLAGTTLQIIGTQDDIYGVVVGVTAGTVDVLRIN